eukprot:g47397.t1
MSSTLKEDKVLTIESDPPPYKEIRADRNIQEIAADKTLERLRVMPSKKKRAAKVDDDGEDAPNPVFTLGQRLDKTKLKRISMLYAVVGQEERQVNELLESCKLNRPEVDYMPGIHDSKGRAYGQNSIGNLPKWIMRIVSGAMYESLDICNAAASILVQLADREQAAVPVLFSRFVHGGREDMQKLLLEQVGKEDTPLNRKWAKKQFNSVINQKSVPADYAIDCPLMRDWAQACKSLGEQLKRFTAFGDVWALAQSLDDKPNKLATFISYVYQRFELQIMLEVMKYCSAQNIQVGVYKYDELLVESDLHNGGVLDQATMQSMISGEDVAVPRKHKTAVTDLRWSPPLVMAGNIILNYNDEQGQWKRRLALFYWENIPDRVPARWRGLKGRRGGGGRGGHAPRTVDDKPDADFWRDIAPPALKHNQRYTESRMNFLARFLHEGSREQGVIPDKGRLTEWTNFVSVYGQYLKELEQGNTKASDDIPLAALRGNGYEVFPPLTGPGAGRGAHKKDRRAYFCVYCPHSKDGSGHQCNPAGICRDGLCWYVNCKNEAHKGAGVLKAHGIVNMRIVTRAEFDRWLIITEEAGSESEPSESLSKSLSESPSVKEWQERVLTLAAAQENTEKIRRATEKMLEANSKAERKAERRRVCQIAGIKDWKALKKKYKEAHKRKGEEQQAQGASSKRSRLSAEAVQERAEKYTSDKNEHNE